MAAVQRASPSEVALFSAVKARKANKITEALKAGARISARDAQGNTPLHNVVKEGDLAFTKQLLFTFQAEPIVKNDAGLQPHQVAAEAGFTDLAAFLYEKTEAFVVKLRPTVNARIFSAARAARWREVEELLEYVENVNCVVDDAGRSLYYTVMSGIDSPQALRSALNAAGGRLTPGDVVAMAESAEDRGSRPDSRGDGRADAGATLGGVLGSALPMDLRGAAGEPFQYSEWCRATGAALDLHMFAAAYERDVPVVSACAQAGANINLTRPSGITALHLLMRTLTSFGRLSHAENTLLAPLLHRMDCAVLDKPDPTTRLTPLHNAVMVYDAELVLALLSAGAKVESVDGSRRTPLELALVLLDKPLREPESPVNQAAYLTCWHLLAAGATPSRDGDDDSAFFSALRSGCTSFVSLFAHRNVRTRLHMPVGSMALTVSVPCKRFCTCCRSRPRDSDIGVGPRSEQLLEHLLDTWTPPGYILLDGCAAHGTTALMMAARNGNPYYVRRLLESGSNAFLTNSSGDTALVIAQSDLSKLNHIYKQQLKEEALKVHVNKRAGFEAVQHEMDSLSRQMRDWDVSNDWAAASEKERIGKQYAALKVRLAELHGEASPKVSGTGADALSESTAPVQKSLIPWRGEKGSKASPAARLSSAVSEPALIPNRQEGIRQEDLDAFDDVIDMLSGRNPIPVKRHPLPVQAITLLAATTDRPMLSAIHELARSHHVSHETASALLLLPQCNRSASSFASLARLQRQLFAMEKRDTVRSTSDSALMKEAASNAKLYLSKAEKAEKEKTHLQEEIELEWQKANEAQWASAVGSDEAGCLCCKERLKYKAMSPLWSAPAHVRAALTPICAGHDALVASVPKSQDPGAVLVSRLKELSVSAGTGVKGHSSAGTGTAAATAAAAAAAASHAHSTRKVVFPVRAVPRRTKPGTVTSAIAAGAIQLVDDAADECSATAMVASMECSPCLSPVANTGSDTSDPRLPSIRVLADFATAAFDPMFFLCSSLLFLFAPSHNASTWADMARNAVIGGVLDAEAMMAAYVFRKTARLWFTLESTEPSSIPSDVAAACALNTKLVSAALSQRKASLPFLGTCIKRHNDALAKHTDKPGLFRLRIPPFAEAAGWSTLLHIIRAHKVTLEIHWAWYLITRTGQAELGYKAGKATLQKWYDYCSERRVDVSALAQFFPLETSTADGQAIGASRLCREDLHAALSGWIEGDLLEAVPRSHTILSCLQTAERSVAQQAFTGVLKPLTCEELPNLSTGQRRLARLGGWILRVMDAKKTVDQPEACRTAFASAVLAEMQLSQQKTIMDATPLEELNSYVSKKEGSAGAAVAVASGSKPALVPAVEEVVAGSCSDGLHPLPEIRALDALLALGEKQEEEERARKSASDEGTCTVTGGSTPAPASAPPLPPLGIHSTSRESPPAVTHVISSIISPLHFLVADTVSMMMPPEMDSEMWAAAAAAAANKELRVDAWLPPHIALARDMAACFMPDGLAVCSSLRGAAVLWAGGRAMQVREDAAFDAVMEWTYQEAGPHALSPPESVTAAACLTAESFFLHALNEGGVLDRLVKEAWSRISRPTTGTVGNPNDQSNPASTEQCCAEKAAISTGISTSASTSNISIPYRSVALWSGLLYNDFACVQGLCWLRRGNIRIDLQTAAIAFSFMFVSVGVEAGLCAGDEQVVSTALRRLTSTFGQLHAALGCLEESRGSSDKPMELPLIGSWRLPEYTTEDSRPKKGKEQLAAYAHATLVCRIALASAFKWRVVFKGQTGPDAPLIVDEDFMGSGWAVPSSLSVPGSTVTDTDPIPALCSELAKGSARLSMHLQVLEHVWQHLSCTLLQPLALQPLAVQPTPSPLRTQKNTTSAVYSSALTALTSYSSSASADSAANADYSSYMQASTLIALDRRLDESSSAADVLALQYQTQLLGMDSKLPEGSMVYVRAAVLLEELGWACSPHPTVTLEACVVCAKRREKERPKGALAGARTAANPAGDGGSEEAASEWHRCGSCGMVAYCSDACANAAPGVNPHAGMHWCKSPPHLLQLLVAAALGGREKALSIAMATDSSREGSGADKREIAKAIVSVLKASGEAPEVKIMRELIQKYRPPKDATPDEVSTFLENEYKKLVDEATLHGLSPENERKKSELTSLFGKMQAMAMTEPGPQSATKLLGQQQGAASPKKKKAGMPLSQSGLSIVAPEAASAQAEVEAVAVPEVNTGACEGVSMAAEEAAAASRYRTERSLAERALKSLAAAEAEARALVVAEERVKARAKADAATKAKAEADAIARAKAEAEARREADIAAAERSRVLLEKQKDQLAEVERKKEDLRLQREARVRDKAAAALRAEEDRKAAEIAVRVAAERSAMDSEAEAVMRLREAERAAEEEADRMRKAAESLEAKKKAAVEKAAVAAAAKKVAAESKQRASEEARMASAAAAAAKVKASNAALSLSPTKVVPPMSLSVAMETSSWAGVRTSSSASTTGQVSASAARGVLGHEIEHETSGNVAPNVSTPTYPYPTPIPLGSSAHMPHSVPHSHAPVHGGSSRLFVPQLPYGAGAGGYFSQSPSYNSYAMPMAQVQAQHQHDRTSFFGESPPSFVGAVMDSARAGAGRDAETETLKHVVAALRDSLGRVAADAAAAAARADAAIVRAEAAEARAAAAERSLRAHGIMVGMDLGGSRFMPSAPTTTSQSTSQAQLMGLNNLDLDLDFGLGKMDFDLPTDLTTGLGIGTGMGSGLSLNSLLQMSVPQGGSAPSQTSSGGRWGMGGSFLGI